PPGKEYNPLLVVELRKDPRVEPGPRAEDGPYRDPFIFRKRMRALAGKPVVIQVKRASDEVVNILVPPAYHVRFGARMEMGEVAGVPGKLYVHLTVKRIDPSSNQAKSSPLPRPLLWDRSMNDSQETPQKNTSPLSIPQLGLAYWVESKIEAVEPDSPAARARK